VTVISPSTAGAEFTAPLAAVSVSGHDIAPAPGFSSQVTVMSPSPAGADLLAALAAARGETTGSPAPTLGEERTRAAVLSVSQGPALPAAQGNTGLLLAPHAVRPLSTGAAATAALDLLLSGGAATLPEEEDVPAPGACPDRPPAPQGAPLFDDVIDRLFGEDAALLPEGAINRLFGGGDGLIDGASWAADGAVAAAAAVLGAGYLRGSPPPRRERKYWLSVEGS
jgi:hypothetical protein